MSTLDQLRTKISALEQRPVGFCQPMLPFGVAEIDRHLPQGGLARGVLHEVAGSGAEMEHGAAATLFIAGILARLRGPVLWVLGQADLFAPGLAGVGLEPDRVIYAEAGRPEMVLQAMEDGLQHPALAAVVGEIGGKLTLMASRRLQLAAESSGVMGFVLRRSRKHDDPELAEPVAAVTRWRVGSLPSEAPFPDAPDVPGLGPALWQVDLTRCRGGKPVGWIVEACNEEGQIQVAYQMSESDSAKGSFRTPAAAGAGNQ